MKKTIAERSLDFCIFTLCVWQRFLKIKMPIKQEM